MAELWPRRRFSSCSSCSRQLSSQWLPGETFEGPITPTGSRPRYKLNGIAAWLVTHALFFGCSYGLGLFNAGIVWDHFGAILATLVAFALVFCLFLYFKGRYRPTSDDRSVSGNFIWDYYWGVELHPALFGVNLKQLVNCRLSMMGWSVIVCSFAAKQAELTAATSATRCWSRSRSRSSICSSSSGGRAATSRRSTSCTTASATTFAGACWRGCLPSTR